MSRLRNKKLRRRNQLSNLFSNIVPAILFLKFCFVCFVVWFLSGISCEFVVPVLNAADWNHELTRIHTKRSLITNHTKGYEQ